MVSGGIEAIVVFGRVPVPGEVKTRLAADVGAEAAADLYAGFLGDTLALAVSLDATVRLYLAPTASPLPDHLVPAGVVVLEQRGEDLGARMLRAIVETFATGAERVVLIGSDAPSLPGDFVRHALDALSEPDTVVLGPATDGGYYLIGMNELYPTLFRDIQYGGPDVFVRTLEAASRSAANITLLPTWFDVDTRGDLGRLAAELGNSHAAPMTRKALERHGLTL